VKVSKNINNKGDKMKRIIIMCLIVITTLLTGCQKNTIAELEDQIVENEKVIEELTQANDDLSEENGALSIKNLDLENSIAVFEESESAYIQNDEEQKQMIDALTADLEQKDLFIEDLINNNGNGYTTAGNAIRIVSYQSGYLKYMFEDEENETHLTHTIIGYDQDFYDAGNIEVLDFSGDSTATVKFKVFGSLYNFKITIGSWDNEFEHFNEETVICDIDEVRNQDVLFASILAEGMPYEQLSWTDPEGNLHTMLIGEDGYGFAGSIIICDLLGQE